MNALKYAFILIALFTLSCKKDKVNNPYSKTIVGQWQLVSYGGGFDGRTSYPNANEKTTLTFNADRTYFKTVNGNTTAKGTYTLGQAHSIYSGNDDNALKFNNSDHWNIISIDDNTLEINSNVYDGGGSSYKKQP